MVEVTVKIKSIILSSVSVAHLIYIIPGFGSYQSRKLCWVLDGSVIFLLIKMHELFRKLVNVLNYGVLCDMMMINKTF